MLYALMDQQQDEGGGTSNVHAMLHGGRMLVLKIITSDEGEVAVGQPSGIPPLDDTWVCQMCGKWVPIQDRMGPFCFDF